MPWRCQEMTISSNFSTTFACKSVKLGLHTLKASVYVKVNCVKLAVINILILGILSTTNQGRLFKFTISETEAKLPHVNHGYIY